MTVVQADPEKQSRERLVEFCKERRELLQQASNKHDSMMEAYAEYQDTFICDYCEQRHQREHVPAACRAAQEAREE